jgi:flagellar biosynthetic protein FliS
MTQVPGAPSRYLDTRVNTASQAELQLMLLDGVARFGRQAESLWGDAGQRSECDRLMVRCMEIVEELVRGVTLGGTEISKRLEDEYAFAFRRLALAQLNRDKGPLAEALKLLELHRETWRLACEKLRSDAGGTVRAPFMATELPAAAFERLSLQG